MEKKLILAITNNKIPKVSLDKKCTMKNIFGKDINQYKSKKSSKMSRIYDYFKDSQQVNRKTGHITSIFN